MALEGAIAALGGTPGGGTPPAGGMSAFPVESPSERMDRLKVSLDTLHGEMKDNPGDPYLPKVIDRLQSRLSTNDPFGTGKSQPPAQSAATAPDGDALSGAIKALSEPEPKTESENIPKAVQNDDVHGIPAGSFQLKNAPLADTIASLGTGAASTILGGLVGAYKLLTGQGPETAAHAVGAVQQAGTHQPETSTGQAIVKGLGSPYNPLNWPQNIVRYGAEKIGETQSGGGSLASIVAPTAALLEGGAAMVAPGSILKVLKPAAEAGTVAADAAGAAAREAKFGSVGASATSNRSALASDVAGASPELRAKLESVPIEKQHETAVTRQVTADSLPVPMRLTRAQAVGDVAMMSDEYNNKGRLPEIGKRYEEQGKELHQNLEAIRDETAPDVFGTDHVQNGQTLIDKYRSTDVALRGDISTKYKALENANGGQFPLDGIAFVDSADAALQKQLKTHYVPADVRATLNDIRSGGRMTFEDFETLRSDLADTARNAADGKQRAAANIIRDSLENMPLTPEAAALKPLADTARSAAKARFDLIDGDPAYKAALKDNVSADNFIQKYVVGGDVANVKTMVRNLGEGSQAHQTMAAGLINYLHEKAGTDFSQATYNRALNGVSPDGKLVSIVGPTAAKQLQTVGDVATWTQKIGRGGYANTSHTLVGAMAEHAKSGAEGMANVAFHGVPVGTWTRKIGAGIVQRRELRKILEPGAGIEMKRPQQGKNSLGGL